MKKNTKLLDFRLSSGLTIREMALTVGISKSYYEKIESGLRNPSFNFIDKFKTKFKNADTDSLFFTYSQHETCIEQAEVAEESA